MTKSVQILQQTRVPILGVIENMSYFSVDGERHNVFGKSAFGIEAVQNLLRSEKERETFAAFQLPVDEALADCDKCPAVDHIPSSEASDTFLAVAQHIVTYVANRDLENRGKQANTLMYSGEKNALVFTVYEEDLDGVEIVDQGKQGVFRELHIAPSALRKLSRDATSTTTVVSRTQPAEVIPTQINRKGNYGFEVQWSDGLRGSIYTFVSFQYLAIVVRVVWIFL